MHRFIEIKSPDELARLDADDTLPVMDAGDLARHAPDAHWRLLDGDGRACGRCSLWWRNTPPYPGHRLGLIGHYAVRDGEAARELLAHACRELAARDCTLAVAPMDGNTWRRYRWLTERGSEPAFFLEPDNPDDWPGHFVAQGFTSLANYTSALVPDLAHDDSRLPELERRVAARGVQLRAMKLAEFEDELLRIYAVSIASFGDNFLYTPMAEAEFITQFRKLERAVRPELVQIAEAQGQAVGFLFTVPDMLQAARGQTIDTAVLKSLAVLPAWTGFGLGGLLMARAQRIARELGYQRAIHALMHETNRSRNISDHYARTMRRYALFAKPLRP
ncbi:MAG: GNAT family N-acetyltransferase [Verrucomicrobiia bacterium]|jgi:predicted N-acetyltransferase YhbS